ncbi:sorbitol dehydrogenase [Lineolata rhizophorae]|uniref:D-xylulose reductase n=1 Tax=Lineolata rhizophorae TaxID=578093 RepID=A0A6A6NWY6_9PEZI|nr:sorbitol dehydrogenase [Lineolata rhizophorae]
MQNPSWFLYGPGVAKIEDRAIPTIGDSHDVILRIAYVGVCGSDVHFWKHGGIRKVVSPERPLVMGHEASGTVHSVGPDVTSVKVGDRVAVEPGFPCRRCKACKDGVYNLCRQMRFAADPPDTHGALTKFYAAPEDFLYKIPDGVSLEGAVLVEPLAVAVHATRLGSVRPGQDVIVMGSETIGLMCGAVAKAFSANRIILVDIVEKKLEFAREHLKCETFFYDIKSTSEDNATGLLNAFDIADGVDAVIEASGAETSIQSGIHLLKLGGNFVQAGLGKPKIEVPIIDLSTKELHFHGCFRYSSGDYELALKLLSKRDISLRPLISSVTPFEQATTAWDKTGKGEGIKNLIQGVKD